MLLPNVIHAWREPNDEFHIEWRTSHAETEVTIEHAQGKPLEANFLQEGNSARVSGLEPAHRHFFRISDQFGTEVLVGERRLAMEGTPNFRDFGGYQTESGLSVKWGHLFRSGQLSNLSQADLETLSSLNLHLVCDFRREEEQQAELSRLPPENTPRIVSLPIVPGSNSRFFEESQEFAGNRQAMFDFMLEINRDFAEAQTETYGRMFAEILEVEDARFLVHCAAGKDRTGFAAALILRALGVPREAVLHDYMLTARFFEPSREVERLKEKYDMQHMPVDSVLPMLEVHEQYLVSGLGIIEENFPSIEVYLEEALGVGKAELAELRARYLA
jgi:protein-tyrosine phosphatase